MDTVTYTVTGYQNETLIVKFSLGEVSESLNFQVDTSRTIKEFLDEQAMWVLPRLKQKRAYAMPLDMMSFVGMSGAVVFPETPVALPTMQPSFFVEHPTDPTLVAKKD